VKELGMTKSKRLKPLIKLAEEREQVAIKQYVETQKIHRDRQARLEELQSYKTEYQNRFVSADSAARSAFQFNDYLAFLSRLDSIITEQRRLVVQCEKELELKRKAWLKRREKAQALGKAAERFLNEERAIQNKREQKDADERAQRCTSSHGEEV
jgi:flagellar FliJ protein